MQHYVNIIINSVFIENILLYFLEMPVFIDFKKVETSIGLGLKLFLYCPSLRLQIGQLMNTYLQMAR